MYYKKTGFPEEGELVLCTITNIQYHSVFARLDEYDKTGMIHISEVSPGRIRNIRDFVKEGKKVVCKVLRINPSNGHIDLSLRRVTEGLRREKMDKLKQEQKAEKLIEDLAKELKGEPAALYEKVAKPLLQHYEYIFQAFEDVVENDASLEKSELDKALAAPLERLIKERLKPKSITVGGDIFVQSYAESGLDVVKGLLMAAKAVSPAVELRYRGAGHWGIRVTAPDYKEGERILTDATDALSAGKKQATVTFEKEEKKK